MKGESGSAKEFRTRLQPSSEVQRNFGFDSNRVRNLQPYFQLLTAIVNVESLIERS